MIYFYLVIAGVIWGLNIIVVKMNSLFFHPLFLICLKMIISTLSMGIYLGFTHHRLIKVSIKYMIIDANLVNVLNFVCTYFAIFLLSGCTSATLNCLSPIIMIILVFIFERKISYQDIILLVLGLLGFLITIRFQVKSLSVGHYLMLSGLVLYNGGNYLMKKRELQDVLVYNFYLLFLSMIELIIICAFINQNMIIKTVDTLSLWLLILTSGIGYAYIQSIYFLAIKQIGVIKTSFFLSLNPIFTCLFSFFILHEQMSQYAIVGFLVIVYTLFLKYHFSSK
ncbi:MULTISPECIES: DMT family transporter [Coprobacillaceae]|uniref:DMT family transporter n=1 Tax=Coprobacillaceae TaxID=2810280 RepID=UPI000E523E2E|nr:MULTISPECIES: DMT family transporter [Coprobacillaceae]RHM62580.1 DMT family transporter [Coprobacillus sp. AF33-1AC]RHS93398.1 DMT family transporter [Erysipelatoclostridium sp. AM42-17]